MSCIDICRGHGLGHECARAIVDDVAAEMRQKFATDNHWQEDTLHFSRPGINGQIRIEDGQVHFHAQLGLLFGAMKPVIEREIERALDERFHV